MNGTAYYYTGIGVVQDDEQLQQHQFKIVEMKEIKHVKSGNKLNIVGRKTVIETRDRELMISPNSAVELIVDCSCGCRWAEIQKKSYL